MALDLTTIAGYRADMTADEKLSLLENYEPPKPDLTGYIQKSAFDKTASELAETKRQLKAKLSEDEIKEAERIANEAAIKAELESLKKDKTTSQLTSKYLGLGLDPKLAAETAQAQADGDTEKVFANLAIHNENLRKATTAAALAGDPKPPAGSGKEPDERQKLIEQYNAAETRYKSSRNINEIALMQSLDSQIKALTK